MTAYPMTSRRPVLGDQLRRCRRRTAEPSGFQAALGLIGHLAGEPEEVHTLGAPRYQCGVLLANAVHFAAWLTTLTEQGGEIVAAPHTTSDRHVHATVTYLAWRVILRYEPVALTTTGAPHAEDQPGQDRSAPAGGAAAAGHETGVAVLRGGGGPDGAGAGDAVPGDADDRQRGADGADPAGVAAGGGGVVREGAG